MGLKKEDEDDIGQESILIKILDVINRFVLIYNQMFHLTAQAFWSLFLSLTLSHSLTLSPFLFLYSFLITFEDAQKRANCDRNYYKF